MAVLPADADFQAGAFLQNLVNQIFALKNIPCKYSTEDEQIAVVTVN